MRVILLAFTLLVASFPAMAEDKAAPVNSPLMQGKAGKPMSLDDMKKTHGEVQKRLLTEEPKDAMQAVMAMGTCIQRSTDMKAMQKLEKQGRDVDAQVKALCKAGKDNEAAALIRQYTSTFAASKEYAAMKACGEKYKAFMQDPLFESTRKQMDKATASSSDICSRNVEKPTS